MNLGESHQSPTQSKALLGRTHLAPKFPFTAQEVQDENKYVFKENGYSPRVAQKFLKEWAVFHHNFSYSKLKILKIRFICIDTP